MEERGVKKGQSWSMDLVIAVVVFGFMAVIFYSLVIIQDQPSVEELEDNAQKINARLEQGLGRCGAIVAGQTIDQTQLQCLFGYNYDELKAELGIEGDFCIYLESTQGGLYIVQNNSVGNKTAIGNPALVVSGTPCGQAVTASVGGIEQPAGNETTAECVRPSDLKPAGNLDGRYITLSWQGSTGVEKYVVQLYNTTPSSSAFYAVNSTPSCAPAYRCYDVTTTSIQGVPAEPGVGYTFTVTPVYNPPRSDSCYTQQWFYIVPPKTALNR